MDEAERSGLLGDFPWKSSDPDLIENVRKNGMNLHIPFLQRVPVSAVPKKAMEYKEFTSEAKQQATFDFMGLYLSKFVEPALVAMKQYRMASAQKSEAKS